LHDQLPSLAGEFFDPNQETGALFHGSLAAILAMRGSGGFECARIS
jgi:hypothetical protein